MSFASYFSKRDSLMKWLIPGDPKRKSMEAGGQSTTLEGKPPYLLHPHYRAGKQALKGKPHVALWQCVLLVGKLDDSEFGSHGD